MDEIWLLVIGILLIYLGPAILMVLIGLSRLKSRPESAKKLFIAAGIYFLIGTGICGALIG
ncbi:MAG: hypothetical protein ACXIUD_04645 [Mongoliitalea sp.]